MRHLFKVTIENKILIPFVCISLVTVASFCFILYRTEYSVMISTETTNAVALVDYINADIDAGEYWKNQKDLLEKYENSYLGDSLFIFDGQGSELFARREISKHELVLAESRENRLGWQISYSLDKTALRYSFIEEQRYMILAAVAMVIVIVQASVLIAHNISSPIRELSERCSEISITPEGTELMDASYVHRHDEVGQLATAFQTMLESVQHYTDELSRVKALNENIVENLPLGVIAYNNEGDVIFSNSRAEAMLATNDQWDEMGHSLHDCLEKMQQRGEILPQEIILLDTVKRQHHYECGAWKLQDEAHTNWGTLYTLDDVTYQRHMEEKLSREEKLSYTGELAADVAHEARNPLAGIRTGLQVIDRKLSEERDKLLCREMVKEVDRVDLLVSNLVNISRRQESKKSTVLLKTIYEELEMLYSKVAENKGISFFSEMEGGIYVYADERELRQMLINLINNSIKAMPDGGQIILSGNLEGENICLSVSDNGPGMDAEQLARAVSGEGGGLGLSIVQRLAKSNSGELKLFSAPGEGTSAKLIFRRLGGQIHAEI